MVFFLGVMVSVLGAFMSLDPAQAFIPQGKMESIGSGAVFSDDLLRQVVERMGQDLAEAAADAYLDIPPQQQLRGLSPSALALGALKVKELEAEAEEEAAAEEAARRFLESGGGREAVIERPGGHLGLRANHPMTRDREYLQHSTLWGHQYMPGGSSEGKQRISNPSSNRQDNKADSVLPAYCNPPNPCPIGYSASDGCLETFENTASFSRDFQANQDCMCDSEHMFDCPGSRDDGDSGVSSNSVSSGGGSASEGNGQRDLPHKSLVAKKFHVKKDGNPFLRGEKLPVAAKKGIKVGF